MAAVDPCVLAIGGLDPGGGAGIAADLRAFAAAGVFGCAAVSIITVQSTAGLRKVRAVPASELVEQVNEVLRYQRVRAIKVGALGSRENVVRLGQLLAKHSEIPIVVDTPMLPTRGRARLLEGEATALLKTAVMARATLATVNAPEAATLLGRPVRALADARDAARDLLDTGARAVLVKGGHLLGASAVDVLAMGTTLVEICAGRLALSPTHGSGCTLASLIAARLARDGVRPPDDANLLSAIRWAKRVHHRALTRTVAVGSGARVLVF